MHTIGRFFLRTLYTHARLAAHVGGLFYVTGNVSAAVLHLTGEFVSLAEIGAEYQVVGVQVHGQDNFSNRLAVAHVQGQFPDAVLEKYSWIQPEGSSIEWDFFYPDDSVTDPIISVYPDDYDTGPPMSPRLDVWTDMHVGEFVVGWTGAYNTATNNPYITLTEALQGNTFEATFFLPGGIPGVTSGSARIIVQAPMPSDLFADIKTLRIIGGIPEPSTLVLLLLGAILLLPCRQRGSFRIPA
jgi:hypothetical protein